jgi:hypothetical protein
VHITYDDGDEEDMALSELASIEVAPADGGASGSADGCIRSNDEVRHASPSPPLS